MRRFLLALSAAVLAVAPLVAGCTEDDPAESCAPPADPAPFEAGTGETCFERVAQGQTLPMIAGPQGGFHLWLAIGCTDCGSSVHLRTRVLDPTTGADVPGTALTEEIVDLGGERWPQRAGIQVGMPGSEWEPEEDRIAAGTPLVIAVEALAKDGAVVHAAELAVVLGETRAWDPCDTDPDDESCGCSDCN